MDNRTNLDLHLGKIREVIVLMQHELTRNNGLCGGKINFGDYTSSVPPFDDGNDWLKNRYKPQTFKSVAAILLLGINNHRQRIEILERMKNAEYIYPDEHLLLLEVKALNADPFIANYDNIYIRKYSMKLEGL